MKQIKHQKQGERDCVCTCIAMIADINKNIIRKRYHEKFMNDSNFNENNILDCLGIKYNKCYDNILYSGRIYLALVPSLNMPGYFHQVIIDNREDTLVLDPNRGRPGKNYYVINVCPSATKQIKLRSWILEYEVYI